MHIVPSRGRPEVLQRFFDEGKPRERGLVVIDNDQIAMYKYLRMPDNWRITSVTPMLGFVAKLNLGFCAYPDEPWYAWGGDDCVGRTPGWDTILAGHAMKGYVAWGNDLLRGACTHPFLPGDLCRQFGWVAHPAFKHLYVDLIWETIAKHDGIDRYCPDVIQEAHHFSNGKMPRDQTSLERMERGDHATYKKFDYGTLQRKVDTCGC